MARPVGARWIATAATRQLEPVKVGRGGVTTGLLDLYHFFGGVPFLLDQKRYSLLEASFSSSGPQSPRTTLSISTNS